MRRAILFVTLVIATAALGAVQIDAQSRFHTAPRFPSMTFVPREQPLANPALPTPRSEPSAGAKALEQATAEKLADANASPAGIDCKMVRAATQGLDPKISRSTPPTATPALGRVIAAPSCAKK